MAYIFTCTHFISSQFVPGSFRTQVISYPSHFAQCCSFRTVLILALLDVNQRSFTEVDLSGVRPSICLSVCLSVNMFVDGPELFSVLAQFDIERNILTKFKKHPPSGLGGDAITRKCLQIYGKTDRRTNRRRRDPPQKSSSTSSSANDQGAICEGITHTLRIQIPGELYEDGSDMRTYRYA